MFVLGDNKKLASALADALAVNDKNTIGLLQEHLLHRTLKFYYSSNLNNQEIKIGNMFADVMIDNHIYEIQTKQFNLLRDKLNLFLKDYPVTIVYPIASNKIITLLDINGELISNKKSPRHGSPFELFIELYKIKNYLNNPNLSFNIVLLDIEEYREKEEKWHYHSKGYTRQNQKPLAINQIITLNNKDDYYELLNHYALPAEFDSKMFATATHVLKNKASTILNVLLELGIVERVGKKGRSYIYKTTTSQK